MIDTVNLKANWFSFPESINCKLECIGFTWHLQHDKLGLPYYVTYFDKLRLKWKNDKLYISNSLHVFRKGENYSDLCYDELKEAIFTICNRLSLSPKNVHIVKLSYGVNYNQFGNDYTNWFLYKGNKAEEMLWKKEVYGRRFRLTDYCIKGYNKQSEQKIHYDRKIESLERFEIEYKYMRHFKYKNLRLSDLLEPCVLNFCCDDILIKYNQIKRSNIMNLKELTNKELRIIACMEHDAIRNEMKLNRKETYKNEKKTYNRLIKKVSVESDKNISIIIEKVEAFKSGFSNL
jgi:hypothetical protein